MTPGTQQLVEAAHALGELRDRVVFIGGAATSLLITDRAGRPPRATDDVDGIADQVSSRADWARVESRLRELGFNPDPTGPVCRWRKAGLTLDLMPADASILGFSSRWYADAARHSDSVLIGGMHVRVASAPYFLATKLEAFINRGAEDPYASVDLEDVVALIDGRQELPVEVEASPANVREYIAEVTASVLDRGDVRALVASHLAGDATSQARALYVLSGLKRLARRQ